MHDEAASAHLLSATPAVLEAWLPGLPRDRLDAPEAPGRWSPREVVAHMADLEADGWIPRARHLLEHGTERPLPGIERERFRARFADAALPEVLAAFRSARERNLEVFRRLPGGEEARIRRGRHPELGVVTLSQLLATWVVHDQTHLAQIARTLASGYREAVGPWAAYLSVLRHREEETAG